MNKEYGAKIPEKIEDDDNFEAGLATKVRPKTKKPAMYKVLMLNDDYTRICCSYSWTIFREKSE
jgi:ATP-dependent Clp protease adapter protein ClpS